ncbi:MAG: M1 family aminopeptidase [candidate division WOR-3 bacterium]
MTGLFLAFLSQVFPHSYDVGFYGIYLTLDPVPDTIFGMGEIKGRAISVLDSVDFHLGSALNIDSIRLNGSLADFTRRDDTVWVRGPVPQDFTLEVFYHGHPTAGLYFNYWGAFSACLSPDGVKDAHQWYPCYDHNGDKADSARFAYTVPKGFDLAANGTLDSVDDQGDWKTFYWSVHYPIANYLVAVSASDKYAKFTDSWQGMPLWYYPFNLFEDKMRADVQSVPDMLDYFSSVFGDYPFRSEKFGYAQSNLWGGGFALEHQTMVALGSYWITGDGRHILTYAHELSHQWWGDWVTCQDWPHVWLNEGFASYCEALYAEHIGGVPKRDSVMRSFKNLYFSEDAQARFPIYDPPAEYMWGYTVYKKGAWVLHMLRWVMGDQGFFTTLKNYRNAYGGGTATIPDFQAEAEAVYGSSLDWFFREWIYEAGYPEFYYNWFARDLGDKYEVNLYLNQVQQNAPVFIMPVEIMMVHAPDTFRDTVWVNERAERFSWLVQFRPETLLVDPGEWVLKKIRYTELAESPSEEGLLSLRVTLNPVRGDLPVSYSIPEDGEITLRIYDVSGRLIYDVLSGYASAGRHELRVPVSSLSQGVYFLRMRSRWGCLTRKFTVY